MDNIESVYSNEDILIEVLTELEDGTYNTEIYKEAEETFSEEETEGVQIVSEPSPVTIAEGTFDGIYSRLEECILLLTILVFMTMLTFSKQIFATWRNNMKGRN